MGYYKDSIDVYVYMFIYVYIYEFVEGLYEVTKEYARAPSRVRALESGSGASNLSTLPWRSSGWILGLTF